MAEPLPDLTADWKAIRRLSDVIFEAVDNTVGDLIEEFNLDLSEEAVEELTIRVYNLATQGDQP